MMNKNINLILSVLIALSIIGCKEISPYINLVPDRTIDDTTFIISPVPTPESKNVLIEEFSGVKCANCPKAQLEAKTISENFPGRINVITVHPLGIYNALTRPFDKAGGDEFTSKYDFRTEAGAKIFELIGPGALSSIPIGNVNRKLFNGESFRNIDYPKWSAYVNSELSVSTPVNIKVNARNTSESVEIEVTITYTENVPDSNFITVSILESDIEDPQESKDLSGNTIFIENYIHKHILRAVVTGYYGDLLKASYEPGRVFYKKYSFKRDPKWNSANLDVLALVHLNTTKKDVLHSKTVKVN